MTKDIRGFDAIDGTAVLDVKPRMNAILARGDIHEPAWATS